MTQFFNILDISCLLYICIQFAVLSLLYVTYDCTFHICLNKVLFEQKKSNVLRYMRPNCTTPSLALIKRIITFTDMCQK